ncbi:MAG: molybdenum cofactor guanylyltransferase, partial [Synergistaceae bacterium]|nr:molybdenum cofactor guanylyltransferase [Synergistaceae bacterium]
MDPRGKTGSIGGSGILPASAVILGGGRGRRMGGNKLFLATGEILLVERVLSRVTPWFSEVLIAVGPEDEAPLGILLAPIRDRWPLRVVLDETPRQGPLEGLSAALGSLRTDWAFVIGCDMPFVQEAVMRVLWNAATRQSQVVCARLDGFLEPLHAFYAASCLPAIRRALSRGERKIKSFYDEVNVTVLKEENFRFLPGYRRSFVG